MKSTADIRTTGSANTVAVAPSGTWPRIIRLNEVMRMTGSAKSTLYKWIADGEFPEPVKLGRSSGWLENEIIDWIYEKSAQRKH